MADSVAQLQELGRRTIKDQKERFDQFTEWVEHEVEGLQATTGAQAQALDAANKVLVELSAAADTHSRCAEASRNSLSEFGEKLSTFGCDVKVLQQVQQCHQKDQSLQLASHERLIKTGSESLASAMASLQQKVSSQIEEIRGQTRNDLERLSRTPGEGFSGTFGRRPRLGSAGCALPPSARAGSSTAPGSGATSLAGSSPVASD